MPSDSKFTNCTFDWLVLTIVVAAAKEPEAIPLLPTVKPLPVVLAFISIVKDVALCIDNTW